MIVANYNDNRLQVIDRLKEMVRLASGLDEKNVLSDESMDRAIECLNRFGQRIREIPRTNVRAVGTNTLRKARNGNKFLARAHEALGHTIEIISGLEEARLIYQGVAHSNYESDEKRLVIDIGGGSTELILGKEFTPHKMESLYIGCVSISQEFFSKGEVTNKRMRNAIMLAQQELESAAAVYRKAGWDSAIGSSGTILTINDVMKFKGWSNEGINADALEKLKQEIIDVRDVSNLNFEGLGSDRKPVFAGGVAILCAIFEALKLKHISVSQGALREGLLYDMLGRLQDIDIRDKTVRELAERYSTDTEHAERIRKTVEILFDKTMDEWKLYAETDLKLLVWAALTHEIGMAIAHAQYHRHGAYLISNADMPGFSNQEQYRLAMLLRAHRRKFPSEEMALTPEQDKQRLTRLCILFRLAVLLNRSRFYTSLPKIKVKTGPSSLKLSFPEQWLDEHPLTNADLESEQRYLAVIGFQLEFS